MSWQAMQAVQDYSTLTSEEHTGLVILLAIARFCDHEGRSPDNREKAPSMMAIADAAHCSKRTVINWIPKLEEKGELNVERFGRGKGQWNCYTINLPIGEDGFTNNESIGESIGESQSSPILDLLVKQGERIEALLVKLMVNNGEAKDSPVKNSNEEYIYIHPDPDPIAAIKTALAKVSKTILRPETAEDYDRVAHMVMGYDGDPEQVAGFGEWWRGNSYYNGLPALKTVEDEYRNYLLGVKRTRPNSQQNGNLGALTGV